MNSSVAVSKVEERQTLHFFNIPKIDRDEIFKKIDFFTGGQIDKLNGSTAKLAVENIVGLQGSCFVGKPKVETRSKGDVLLIPILSHFKCDR